MFIVEHHIGVRACKFWGGGWTSVCPTSADGASIFTGVQGFPRKILKTKSLYFLIPTLWGEILFMKRVRNEEKILGILLKQEQI